MFLALLILIVTALFLSGNMPDQYGWMMLLGLSWLAGYLDCRRFARSDQDRDLVAPPDMGEPIEGDRLREHPPEQS